MAHPIPPPGPPFPPSGGGGQTNVPPGRVIAGQTPASTSPARFYHTFPPETHTSIVAFAKNTTNAIYDLQTTVQLTAAAGQLHATVASGAISSVAVLKGGQYASPPAISVVGGGGSGASLTAVLNQAGVIVSVTINAPGTGYTSAPALVIG